MNPERLLQFFDLRAGRGESMVLATVFETRGSTYSKAGAYMLIDGNGIFQGMLSGGCLEGDLAIRARVVLESDQPQTVTYDLAQGDDDVWGLGVGCDGMMRIFLQPLHLADEYRPFNVIAKVLGGAASCVVATVIESQERNVSVGHGAIIQGEMVQQIGGDHELIAAINAEATLALERRHSCSMMLQASEGDICVLLAFVETPPRLLVLGGGPDAEPVVVFAAALGWRCTVVDHRQAYIDNGQFAGADTRQISGAGLSESVNLAEFDLAVVMSHHLASDRNYLRQLAQTDIAYIGLLGPVNRRERLLSELGEDAERLQGRLHGPAGLDIGGSGPAPIALSIVAQMQKHLRRHNLLS
jgi:xanthine dehydrogenase accessory factor